MAKAQPASRAAPHPAGCPSTVLAFAPLAVTQPTLKEIRGQERAIERLRHAIAKDRIPHAFLFAGPRGVGKHTTGIALSMALNCDDEPSVGCGNCGICVRIAEGNHPDVRTLATKGAAQIIPIETVRAEVVAAVGLPPHEARAPVFLIEEAADLQGPAANALLKTLEEPPARTHFILARSHRTNSCQPYAVDAKSSPSLPCPRLCEQSWPRGRTAKCILKLIKGSNDSQTCC